MLGEAEVVLAGGIESMSRMPYLIDAEDARWGHKMGNFTLVDAMYRDGFTCSLCGMIMGETAEVLARQYGITREESDAYALESQRRAERAIAAGRFATRLRRSRHGREGASDDRRRPTNIPGASTTIESLRKLPLVFGRRRRSTGHHHRGHLVGHHRRRRGGRADERGSGAALGVQAAGPHHRLGAARRRSAE